MIMIKRLLIALLIVISPAHAVEHSQVKSNVKNPAPDIEVVQVIGRFDKATWKKIMRETQKDFYNAFNELAPYEFKIQCQYKTKKIGSHIRSRECHPNFISQNESKAAFMFRLEGHDWKNDNLLKGVPAGQHYLKKVNTQKRAELENLIGKLLKENSDLAKKYERYQKAKVAYSFVKS